MTRTMSGCRSAVLSVVSAVVCAACASAGGGPAAHSVHASVHVEPPVVASQPNTSAAAAAASGTPYAPAAGAPAAPDLAAPQSGRQPALSPAPERRIRELDVAPGTPIATAVGQIAAQAGLTVMIDPAVQGTTSAHLRNVSIDEALRQLVTPSGASFQIQGSVLRVIPIRMATRTFHLDYVALSRVGTMSTIVQRRLSSNTAGYAPQVGTTTGMGALVAANAAAASGGDVLSAQSVADIWQEIRVALIGIMQAGQPVAHVTTQAGPGELANGAAASMPGGGYSSGAASIPFADGSSLVISPISGLINVTAMPDRLAAVDAFINDFQASVLRQVVIEAKIVEVDLSHSFQYGIDWSAVSKSASGKYGIALSSSPNVQTSGNTGNIAFTLTGGSTQINAVLTALSTQGDVSVLSNEKTTALNNQRAIFDVSTDEVFFSVTRTPLFGPTGAVVETQSSIIPQQISVGVVLDVLPQISADNVLTMDIRPAVTSIDHVDSITTSDGTSASAPVIARREGDTIARLRAGETMIIGGLVQTRHDRTVSGIPVLSDLPLIGKAFQHIDNTESRSELVVFLTPTIVSGQPMAGPAGPAGPGQ